MLYIAVFVSGRGSNLRAVLNDPNLTGIAEVKLLFTDKVACGAAEIAAEHGIPVYRLAPSEQGGIQYSGALTLLQQHNIRLVVLAGFLKLIPASFIHGFSGHIINIHPALLPSFGGKGMYGGNVHTAVWQSGVKISGATVHLVTEEYDRGPIIAQAAVDISAAAAPEDVAAMVLRLEHQLLPNVIRQFALGNISINNFRVTVKNGG